VSASDAVGDPQQVNDQTESTWNKLRRPFPAAKISGEVARGDNQRKQMSDYHREAPERGQKLWIRPVGLRFSIPPRAPSKNWDRKLRSPLVKKIEAALEHPTEVSFTDNPLEKRSTIWKTCTISNLAGQAGPAE